MKTITATRPRPFTRPDPTPFAAIPGGTFPPFHGTPPHDFLVLNQRPDLTPEFFLRPMPPAPKPR